MTVLLVFDKQQDNMKQFGPRSFYFIDTWITSILANCTWT